MLLLDNSAWARLESPSLPESRRLDIAAMIENGGIAVVHLSCSKPAGRPRAQHIMTRCSRTCSNCSFCPSTPTSSAALSAQRDLAHRGHHRSASPSDLLIAACAHVKQVGVLHYDRDYDLLTELTGLAFESSWLADAGTL